MSVATGVNVGLLSRAGEQADDSAGSVARRYELLVSAVSGLHSNGQATRQTMRQAAELSRVLAIPAAIFLHWGQVLLQVDQQNAPSQLYAFEATPAAVNMSRVKAISQIVDRICDRSLVFGSAEAAMKAAKEIPPSSLSHFLLACIVAPIALAIISGATHPVSLLVIGLSGGLGALLRRFLGSRQVGVIAQSFAAALLAGLIAAAAVHLQVADNLRILAVTPCMILVPGPHIINGSLDTLALRFPLGLSRLSYAGWILGAICAGILIGLKLGGISLPIAQAGLEVPLWIDVVCAGIAAACYGVYFSMPVQMLVWPVLAGMVAHGAHWWVSVAFHASSGTAAGVAGLSVGILLTPVVQRLQLPFAAIGFASVVSLMPGSLVFRMSSGLVQLAQHAEKTSVSSVANTLSDGVTAILVILGLVLGLSLPQHFHHYVQLFRENARRNV